MRAPGSYAGLTVTQAELLSFIRYEAEAGRSPSFDEMRDAMGLSSKSGVSRLLSGLEERGYVQRLSNRARAITAIDAPASPPPRTLSDATIAQLVGELGRRGLRVQLAEASL